VLGAPWSTSVELTAVADRRSRPAADRTLIRQQLSRLEGSLARMFRVRRRPHMHVSEGTSPQRAGDLPPTDAEQTEIPAGEGDLKILRVVSHGKQAGRHFERKLTQAPNLWNVRMSGFCGWSDQFQFVDAATPDAPHKWCVGVHKGAGRTGVIGVGGSR
jgi:hypothetical protein